jgi:hypothetical protein
VDLADKSDRAVVPVLRETLVQLQQQHNPVLINEIDSPQEMKKGRKIFY